MPRLKSGTELRQDHLLRTTESVSSMSTISRQVISLVAGVLAGVIVATLACRYEAEQALSRAEFLLSTTQIRWNVAVLEALAR